MRNKKKRSASKWKKYIFFGLVGSAALSLVLIYSTRLALGIVGGSRISENSSSGSQLDEGVDVFALRAKLFQEMNGNGEISSRDSWDVIQRAAAQDTQNITLYYTRRAILKEQKASRENQSEPDYWNREHLWPRSYGLKGTIADQDLHNLVAVDRTVNSSRGNKYFDVAVEEHYECLDCRVNDRAWEPPDIIKGDIARVLFYMDVRYEGSTIAGMVEPDLVLSEYPDSDKLQFGKLSTLLEWHCNDPVSEIEQARQEIIDMAQGNRNVFIDNPSLAESVYSFRCANL